MAFEDGTLFYSGAHLRHLRALQCTVAAGLGGWLFYQMATTKNPSSVVDVYMVLVGAVVVGAVVGLVRSFHIGIGVDDVGVEARTTFSTKRFAWDQIADAQSVDRVVRTTGRNLVPMSQEARQRLQVVPVLRLTSGKRVRLLGLQVTIESDAISNWLDDAIVEINNRLEERRGALGSGATPPRPS